MSKMKVLNVLVVIALVLSFLVSGSAPAATAVPLPSETENVTPIQLVPQQPTALPLIDDFQSGLVSWFQYGDYVSGAALTQTLAYTTSIATVGVVSNTVSQVDYVNAGWGVGMGKDTIPFQDWSSYDGFRFWFKGTNSGVVYKIILTDNGGERISTQFTDNSTGWQQLSFPWQVFGRDNGFQPGGEPNDGPTLTAVQAFAFTPTTAGSGTFYLDQIELFKNTGSVIDNFQSGLVSWFQYGDYGSGAALTQTLAYTTSIATVGVVSNTVSQVDYVNAGWGVGMGKDTIPFQDWSSYDGFRFWFKGTNSGVVFKIILTDNGGERISTQFTDNSTGWQQLSFPWQVFGRDNGFQPGGEPNDGPTLTAVQAFAFTPTTAGSGTFYLDQIELFKNTGSVIDNFQSGLVSWFQYGDYGSGAALTQTLAYTTSIATVGVVSNTVSQVDYVNAGWGVGMGKDTIPFQDWSGYDGFRFWFKGTNSGVVFKIILTDNGGERISTQFTDNSTGWQQLSFPWQVFGRDNGFQPGGEPNDGPTLTAVQAFAFTPTTAGSGTFYLDQIGLIGQATGTVLPKAGFPNQILRRE